MLKKLLAIFTVSVMLLSCIGAVSVSADELIDNGSYYMSAGGFGIISRANPNDPGSNRYTADKIPYQRNQATAGDPVETKDNLMFFKFDVSELNSVVLNSIEKAELSFYFTGRREQDLRIYAVENDNWTTSTLTWNSVFGEEAQFTPDSEYVESYITRTGVSDNAKLITVNITDILKKGYAEDGVLTFAMGTYSQANQSVWYYYAAFPNEHSYSKPYISIYLDEPIYNIPSNEYSITYSDHGMIRPTAPDTVQNLISSSTRYEPTNGNLSDPYGVDDAVYLKFDLSEVQGEIESATFYFDSSGRRTWNAHLYPVENDNWTHSTLTFNSAYGVEAVEGDPETGDGAVEAQPALYAPKNEPLEFTVSTSGSASPAETNITTEVDVTDLIKSLTVNDDIASFAFMLHTTTSSNSFYFKVNTTNKPRLVIRTKAEDVTADEIKIKVNDTETETLASGIISATAEVTSTMADATRTTMILAVYEGNRLSKVYVSPQQKINDKNTNSGKSLLTVSSNETVEVGENTSVSAFMWKDISLPLPLGSVKTIGR